MLIWYYTKNIVTRLLTTGNITIQGERSFTEHTIIYLALQLFNLFFNDSIHFELCSDAKPDVF